ncbi:MAG: DUF1971 domain-containing protein [Pseudomonadota bacterium]
MKNELPQDVEKYFETGEFTEETLPKKITKTHDTKEGVWGRLVILDGALDYVIPGPPELVQRLSPGVYGVIRPREPHRVAVVGPVRFKIEFYK